MLHHIYTGIKYVFLNIYIYLIEDKVSNIALPAINFSHNEAINFRMSSQSETYICKISLSTRKTTATCKSDVTWKLRMACDMKTVCDKTKTMAL